MSKPWHRETWITVVTKPGKRNIVCGPFDSTLDACDFVSLDFDYEGFTLHPSYEAAVADGTKMAFVPPAESA
jgi:hypothetical protein